ncbi:prephenate dehydrogenase [Breznakiella homolactica]|uniref:Prephenate dehydrogenase n=1 Tax=Breznakiella homolactica TaxID=2798577 RepID=A0A7T7XMK1_9SPIR|nr:prephenate dehydrogenase [Breznakiella homolactica]QQO09120.1 prephenate dehydrogenase [Breznakiella homolactica]
MKEMENLCYGIAGLGLMGGAVAMALRSKVVSGPDGRILAHDIDREILAEAETVGLIDAGFAGAADMLSQCDVVFICLNPEDALAFMKNNMAAFRPGTIITDVTGVKRTIAESMEHELPQDLDFIPGHPMAGSEKGGFRQAAACSFTGKNYILTPLARNRPENLRFIRDLILRMGFGRITETTPEEHDRNIAFTSQLCHVIASSLIDCQDDTAITRFGGGSFEDLTRIAMINAPMWAGLFIENRNQLLFRIEQFESSLSGFKELISGNRRAELEKKLENVRCRRESMV